MPNIETLLQQDASSPNQPARWGQMNSGTAPSAITVTASAFVFQNTSSKGMTVLVSGGTVTTIEFSRDGAAFFLVGLLAGQFILSPNDRLRVTYAIAPTMTSIPF